MSPNGVGTPLSQALEYMFGWREEYKTARAAMRGVREDGYTFGNQEFMTEWRKVGEYNKNTIALAGLDDDTQIWRVGTMEGGPDQKEQWNFLVAIKYYDPDTRKYKTDYVTMASGNGMSTAEVREMAEKYNYTGEPTSEPHEGTYYVVRATYQPGTLK